MANEFIVKKGLIVSGSAEIEQDLRVRGTLTVDEFHTSITTSSILFESGSTKFGNDIGDNHDFTGSVSISGSISLNGQAIGTGKLDETTFNSFTSSYISNSGSFNTRVGNLETFSASLDTSFVSETEFGSYTSSINPRLTAIETSTGSLNTFSASANTRLGLIETSTGSLNNFSGSANTRLGSIETSTGSLNSFTSSINTTIKNKLDTEGIVSGSVQINITGTTGFSSFSSSIASTNLAEEMKLLSLETSTGSLNTFSASANTRLGLIETSTGSLNTFSSSANGRLNALESTTSSINTFTASINTTINNIINNGTLVSGSSQINITGTTGYSSFSSSIATTDLNQENRLSAIETSTGSLNTFTSSANGKLSSIETSTGSLNTFSSSTNGRLSAIETSTSSLNTFTNSAASRLTSIETSTSSLNTFTNSAASRLTSIETSTSSLNTFSSSTNTKLGAIEISTGSLNSFTSSTNNRLLSIETSTGSLNSYTTSNDSKINAIHTATSSLNSFTSSINTTIKNKLNSDGVLSGSIQVDLTSTTNYSVFSASIATTNATQDGRLNSIEGKTGSYATTGSNRFNGNQIVTGSVIITDGLTVLGSSSITYSTASYLNVQNNFISVNASSPAVRYGGLNVYDSGSVTTASLYFDSLTNDWAYEYSSSTVDYAVAMFGPEFTTKGSPTYLTSNRIPKAVDNHHLNDSNISDDGLNVRINSNTTITGSLNVTSTISSTNISAIETTTSSLNSFTSSINTTIKNKLNTEGVVSGSSQISFGGISGVPSGLVSGSSQVLAGTTIHSGSFFNGISVVSGSGQISFGGITGVPSGLVSGSSQVLSGTGIWSGSAQLPSGVVSGSSQVLSGTGIWSGSAQLPSGVVSGSSQVLNGTTIHSGSFFNGISVVSGSGQISFGGITGVPSGLVSGSSQITFSSISGVPSGLVSGSSQISFGSISGVPSGLVSGSSQISFGSISGIPSGLVSGSSQITLSSTTGFGSYLNQAVLTSSTPTFDNLIITNVLRGGIGAVTTSGTLNWNDSTNARSGQGYTLLTGNATNGPGPSEYFHPFSFEYASKDGSGNMTQFAIPYNANQVSMYFRGRYGGTWGSWYTMWNSGNDGSGSGLDADLWDGYHFSDYLNQAVKSTSSPTFAGVTSTSNINANGILLGSDTTYGSPYKVVGFNSTADGGNRILAATGTTDGMYFMASTGNGFNFRPNGGTTNLVNISSTGAFSSVGLTNTGAYSGSGGTFSHNVGNPAGTTELFVHNGTNTPVPFRMTKAGYTGAGGSYGILQLYMNDNTNGNGANLYFCANNSSGTFTEYGGVGMQIKSNTASSETARLYFYRQGRAVNGTFDSDGTLYTVGNIYTNGNGTTTGNLVLNSSNYTSYAMQGAGYSANQNLNTTSSPTFAGITNNGRLSITYTNGTIALANSALQIENTAGQSTIYFSHSGVAKASFRSDSSGNLVLNASNSNFYFNNDFGTNTTISLVNTSTTFLTATSSGVVNLSVAGATVNSNVILHAGNYTSYAMQGAGYSANQNLNTNNAVTFDSVTVASGYNHNTSSSRSKYSVYGSTGNPYVIGMQSGIQYGGLSDWGMTFQFNNDSARGFWWGDDGHNTSQGAMALTTDGRLTVARNIRVGYGESDTAMPSLPLQVYGSGGTVVDIQGSAGQLFSVTDDLTGDIFSISDISGVPMINVNTTNGTSFGSTIFPSANNAYDLGTSSYRWANVYTNDLHLSNEGKSGGNDIDGTTGNWTIQEGAEQLYIINNKNGKKYKINLTEVE